MNGQIISIFTREHTKKKVLFQKTGEIGALGDTISNLL